MTVVHGRARTPVDLVREAVGSCDGTIAVTGATGWFGSVAMDLLYAAFGDEAPRRVVGYARSPREVPVADGRRAAVLPLEDLAVQAPAGLLHFAFVTPDRLPAMGHDAYVARNTAITSRVVDAVVARRPRWVVVASSGAVYGRGSRRDLRLEDDPYGALKRIDELAFRAAAGDVGAACVVPRVFNVGGPRMPGGGVYALGDMLAMAAAGGPVEVRADHPVYRTYCGVDEVVALSVWAAAGPARTTVFDTCGEVVELSDVAARVAAAHGLGPGAVHRTWDPGAAPDSYVGDGRAMMAMADRAGLRLRSLDELIADTSAGAARPTPSR